MFYITLNNSVMTALGKAEELLVSAQNKSQDSPSAPFINVAVEQLKRATSELNNAMKRVGQGLVKGAKLCLNPYFFGWLEK